MAGAAARAKGGGRPASDAACAGARDPPSRAARDLRARAAEARGGEAQQNRKAHRPPVRTLLPISHPWDLSPPGHRRSRRPHTALPI
eukprot:6972224-Prymnesium_polylepis.1